MNVNFIYYHNKTEKHRFEKIESIINMIRECKYNNGINELRMKVRICTENNITNRITTDKPVPRIQWTTGKDGYTGIVTITLPFGDNQELANSLREKVNELPQVMGSFVGSSGRTLKCLFLFRLSHGELSKIGSEAEIARFHKAAHASASAFIFQITGIKPKAFDADFRKATLISCDEHVYYNPEAIAIPIRMPMSDSNGVSLEDITTYNTTSLPDYNTLQMEVTKFNITRRKLAINRETPIDENVMHLANECRRMGISEEVAVKCALAISDEWSHHELLVRTSFETAYSNKHLGSAHAIPHTLFNQLLLRDFMQKRYVFRRNTVTGSCEYMERNKYMGDWKPITDITLNTICLAAQSAGIDAWDKDLQRYVHSELVVEYDPITNWLQALPEWDGRDRVAELAGMIKTDTPKWVEHFRIWMRGMVSQWMNRGGLYGQSLVLMLIGGQGTGKSTFCKRLLPESLSTYYNDRLDFTNKKEADRALMRFVLICLDEYDQISRSRGAMLKNILQKSDVMFRRLYQDEIEQRRRYAAFCATTNSMTPLTDPSGSRRYLCVNITGEIDNTTPIDYEQLYAQIVSEIRNGAPCYLSKADEVEMQKYNLAFYQEQMLEVVLNQYVNKPTKDTINQEFTSLELMKVLRKQVKELTCRRSDIIHLGTLLTQRGFPRRRLAKGWVYQIALAI